MSLETVELFEKIYDGEPILTVVSNIREEVRYLCFNYVYDVRSVAARHYSVIGKQL
jgi:hypothetical protein